MSAQLIKKISNLSELSLDRLIALLQYGILKDEMDMIKSGILKYETKTSGGCALVSPIVDNVGGASSSNSGNNSQGNHSYLTQLMSSHWLPVKKDSHGIGYHFMEGSYNGNFKQMYEEKKCAEEVGIDAETAKNSVLYTTKLTNDEINSLLTKQEVVLQEIDSDKEVNAYKN
ncbi:hypothetical protein L1987_02046 [Smallanthus sonchifolius]|uniref:Uncharacterized protein n=1 Tax=Smallanthus sonchifolius TaxID=185202 RepID=A0ACB9K6P8_9ASTR|nr:hypothetical protein L1987_02046 [Smallanthus sonchifolius]